MNTDQTATLNLLLELGLAQNAAETYLAMLDMESVSIRKVSDKTGINRGTTYEVLKELVKAGLVSTRHAGQREYYAAESPERIYALLQDRRKEIWQAQQLAKELVPALLARGARPMGRPLVRYYEDDEGVVAVLRDVLHTCRQMDEPGYYAYSSRPLRQYIYRKFPKFTQRRIEEGINVKVIAIGEGGEKAAVSERKWLEEPTEAGISSYTLIYGNKIAHISISQDLTPYAVVIEDEGAASMQRLLFEQMWAQL